MALANLRTADFIKGSGVSQTGRVIEVTGGGGGGAFTDLTDVPSSYTSQALKLVRVNAGETGLEFVTAGGGSGTVTSVATTAPITGGTFTTSGTIGITQATTSTDGYLSSTDWNTFNNKQSTGLSWLLASGGTLTADNTLSGSFGIGFGQAVNANNKFRLRGLGTTTGEMILAEDSGGTKRMVLHDNGSLLLSNSYQGGLSSTTAKFFIKGIGSSTATQCLSSFNSSNQQTFYIDDIGSFSSGIGKHFMSGSSNISNEISLPQGVGVSGIIFKGFNSTNTNAVDYDSIRVTNGFTINALTPLYNNITLIPTYNLTSSAAPVLAGFRYNPTFTSSASETNIAFTHDAGFVQWESVLSPDQITADQNDYNPTGLNNGGAPYGASILRLDSDASRNITGLVGGVTGRLLIISNIGSFAIVLKDEDAGSTAANRFAFASDFTLNTDQSLTLWYDGTSSRWRTING